MISYIRIFCSKSKIFFDLSDKSFAITSIGTKFLYHRIYEESKHCHPNPNFCIVLICLVCHNLQQTACIVGGNLSLYASLFFCIIAGLFTRLSILYTLRINECFGRFFLKTCIFSRYFYQVLQNFIPQSVQFCTPIKTVYSKYSIDQFTFFLFILSNSDEQWLYFFPLLICQIY